MKKSFLVLSFAMTLLLPLWSNPGIFWDGWIYHSMIEKGNFFEGIYIPFHQNGRVFSAYLIYFFALFSNPSWAGLIASCLSVSIAGMFFYMTLRRLKILPPLYSALAALLGCIFPAYEVSLSLSAVNFPMSLSLFYAGAYFTIRYLETHGVPALVYAVSAGLLIFLSFTGEATLFLTGFIFILVMTQRHHTERNWTRLVGDVLKKLWWLFGIAAIGLFVLTTFFVPYGHYVDARPEFFPLIALKVFIKYYLVILDFEKIPLACVLLILLVVTLKRKTLKLDQQGFYALVAGTAGFTLAVIAYALGLREPSNIGWALRYFCFSGFPIGLAIAGLCLLIAQNFYIRKSKFYWMIPVLFMMNHLGVLYSHAIDWHIRWIRDQTVISEVFKQVLPGTGLVIYKDQASAMFDETYRDYELLFQTQKALNRTSVVGLSMKVAEELGVSIKTGDEFDFNSEALEGYINKNLWTKNIYNLAMESNCQQFNIDSRYLYGMSEFKKINIISRYYFGLELEPLPDILKVKATSCQTPAAAANRIAVLG